MLYALLKSYLLLSVEAAIGISMFTDIAVHVDIDDNIQIKLEADVTPHTYYDILVKQTLTDKDWIIYDTIFVYNSIRLVYDMSQSDWEETLDPLKPIYLAITRYE